MNRLVRNVIAMGMACAGFMATLRERAGERCR